MFRFAVPFARAHARAAMAAASATLSPTTLSRALFSPAGLQALSGARR